MQPVTASKCDPAPSRWRYRYERLMLTPFFRLCLRVFLPFLIALGAGAIWFSDQDRRDRIVLAVQDIRTGIETRPEFMVNVMAIDGASSGVAEDIREIIPIDFPVSSFDLDLEVMHEQITGLAPVANATVRVRPGGILQVHVTERQPVMLWRSRDGLHLIDREGFAISRASSRRAHARLPLVAGKGADDQVEEALRLFAVAGPLEKRMRGLVRVGERRWDVVLDRGQRIMLPEEGAEQALERVIALEQVQDMLARDLVAVDLRLAARPTIRIAARAVDEWWRIRQIQVEKSDE